MWSLIVHGLSVSFFSRFLATVRLSPLILKYASPIVGNLNCRVRMGFHAFASSACILSLSALFKFVYLAKDFGYKDVKVRRIDFSEGSVVTFGSNWPHGFGLIVLASVCKNRLSRALTDSCIAIPLIVLFSVKWGRCSLVVLQLCNPEIMDVVESSSVYFLEFWAMLDLILHFIPERLLFSNVGFFLVVHPVGMLQSVLQRGVCSRRILWHLQELGELIVICDSWVYTPFSKRFCLCAILRALLTIPLFGNGFVFVMGGDFQQIGVLLVIRGASCDWFADATAHGLGSLAQFDNMFGVWVFIQRRFLVCKDCQTSSRVSMIFTTGLKEFSVIVAVSLTAWMASLTTFLQRHWFNGDFGSDKPSPLREFPIVWFLIRGALTWISYFKSSTIITLLNYRYRVSTLSMVRVLSTDGCWFCTIHTAPATCVEGSTITSSSISPAVRFFKPTCDFLSWKKLFCSLRSFDSHFDHLLLGVYDILFLGGMVCSRMVCLLLTVPSVSASGSKEFGMSTQELSDETVGGPPLQIPSTPTSCFKKFGVSTQVTSVVVVASPLPLHSLDFSSSSENVSFIPCIGCLLVVESFMLSLIMCMYLVSVCRDRVSFTNKLVSVANNRL